MPPSDGRERLEEAHAELVDALRGEVEPERAAALVARMAVAAAEALNGECRKEHDDGQWAALIPVYDDDGLRFCCTGSPSHCSDPIAR
jgi:hypothetical protein